MQLSLRWSTNPRIKLKSQSSFSIEHVLSSMLAGTIAALETVQPQQNAQGNTLHLGFIRFFFSIFLDAPTSLISFVTCKRFLVTVLWNYVLLEKLVKKFIPTKPHIALPLLGLSSIHD